ncbi:MAG: hypothetical protein WBB02_07755 [Saprospiraceae bacterium]
MKYGILMFCAALAIAFSIWSLCVSFSNKQIMDANNTVLKEINSDSSYHKRDSLINEIVELEFEKNSYTQFMDSQSNLIMGYVTLLFALFGITGLVISNRLAQHIKEDYEEQKSQIQKKFRHYRIQQEHKYKIHKEEILVKMNDYEIEMKKIKSASHFALGEILSTNLRLIKFQPTSKALTLAIYSASNFANSDFLDSDDDLSDIVKRNLSIVIRLADSVFNADMTVKNKIIEEYKFVKKDISVLNDMLKITSGEVNDLVIQAKASMLKTFVQKLV